MLLKEIIHESENRTQVLQHQIKKRKKEKSTSVDFLYCSVNLKQRLAFSSDLNWVVYSWSSIPYSLFSFPHPIAFFTLCPWNSIPPTEMY